jgi:WD40 repeat protein
MKILLYSLIVAVLCINSQLSAGDQEPDKKQVVPAKPSQNLLSSDLWPSIAAYSNRMERRQDVITCEDIDEDKVALDLCFSPDSKRAAFSGSDYKVRIYDFKEQKVVRTFEHERICCVDYGKKFLASGDALGLIYMWNPEDGKIKSKCLPPEDAPIFCLKFDESNTHVAFGGESENAYVWDIETLKEVSAFKEHTNGIIDLVWLSSNSIVTADLGQEIRVWDFRSGKQERELDTFGQSNRASFCLRVTADQSTLLWQSAAKLHIWDLRANKKLREVSMSPYYFQSVTLSHDDQIIVTTTSTGYIDLYDRVTGKTIDDVDIGPVEKKDNVPYLSKLTYSPNNKHLAGLMDESMYIWDQVEIDKVLDEGDKDPSQS